MQIETKHSVDTLIKIDNSKVIVKKKENAVANEFNNCNRENYGDRI